MIEDIPKLPNNELMQTSRSDISKTSRHSRSSNGSKGSQGSKSHIIRERDKVVDPYELPEISEEDKRRSMLGHLLTSNGAKSPYLYREDFCGCCGIQHPRPLFLDMYPNCYSCFNVLRPASFLSNQYKDKAPFAPLEILYATYGDPINALTAIDVTAVLRTKVDESYWKDRLEFKTITDLRELFKVDPMPGQVKQLRIRYRMHGKFGCLCLDVMANNHFPFSLMIIRPKELGSLKIVRATYGHPKGVNNQGRMSQEVTELVQGLADLQGSSFLNISSNQLLSRIFGDPCPGYPKDLRIQYEVGGRSSSETYDCVQGFLRRRVFLESSPTVQPLIFVTSAYYGITPTGRRDHLHNLDKKMRIVTQIEHRISEGMVVRPMDLLYLKNKDKLIAEKKIFQNLECKFVDVTTKVQTLCDGGGFKLFLDKKKFDPNYLFGNPSENNWKLLEMNLECQGHDSEKTADSQEMTSSGHPRNCITNKTARIVVAVYDNRAGKGIMSDDINFFTEVSSPIIKIERATYGYFEDLSKVNDVTFEVQAMVTGRILKIEKTLDLHKVFGGDPALGRPKKLKIDYTTRGFSGNVRVRERADTLVATIAIGYPPVPPRDAAEDM